MNRELLKQVLDALKLAVLRSEKIIDKEYDAAIAALQAELAKPEPKPVGYVYWNKGHADGALDNQNLKPGTPLYAAPTEPNCRFPTCHSQEFQSRLADEVASELITHIPAPRGFIAQPSIDGVVRTSTTNCSRHPDAPHGQDGAGCKCHSWSPGEAS